MSMHTSQVPSEIQAPPPDPEPIMRVASGFMAAKHLFAASDAGLFAALADGPLTAAELADRSGIPQASARLSANAMVALGLLELVRATAMARPPASS